MMVQPVNPNFEVYRAYDASRTLLYVGQTKNFKRRKLQHSTKSFWYADAVRWEMEPCDTREEALAVESALIQALAPIHNGVLGRPPLPPEKKRDKRRVVLYTSDEIDLIEAYLAREGVGWNEFLRDLSLAAARDDVEGQG